MAGLQESARWAEARAALERAEARLDGAGRHDLRRRLGQARRDLDLVIQLDAIRLNRVTRGELAFYKARANRDYAEAFRPGGAGNEPRSAVACGGTDQRIGRARGARGGRLRLGGLRHRQGATGLAAGGGAANRLELRRLARACLRSGRMGGSTGAGGIGPDRAGGQREPFHSCWRSGNGSGPPAGTRPRS